MQHDGFAIDRVALPAPPRDADDVVGRFAAAMAPRTRVVSVSHVTFTTGLRLPIRALARVVERATWRGLRFSTHVYNDASDVERAVEGIRRRLG